MAFDENYRVLGQSRAHKKLMHELWGREDMTGVYWMDSPYVSQSIREVIVEKLGGGPSMFRNGLVSARGPFMAVHDGEVINGGHVDSSYLRMADGNIILSFAHRNVDPTFVETYLRPAVEGYDLSAAFPDSITTLDS